MKKVSVFLGMVLLMVGCGSENAKPSVYTQDQTQIIEKAGTDFEIAIALSDEASQSISCTIDQECNSQVATVEEIKIENNTMVFHLQTKAEGETSLGLLCTGSITENLLFTITVFN